MYFYKATVNTSWYGLIGTVIASEWDYHLWMKGTLNWRQCQTWWLSANPQNFKKLYWSTIKKASLKLLRQVFKMLVKSYNELDNFFKVGLATSSLKGRQIEWNESTSKQHCIDFERLIGCKQIISAGHF